MQVFVHAVSTYRIKALSYNYCFSVELTMDIIVAQYLYDRCSLNLKSVGTFASVFYMANFVAGPFGGILSDWAVRCYIWHAGPFVDILDGADPRWSILHFAGAFAKPNKSNCG